MKKILIRCSLILLLSLNLISCELANEAGQSIKDAQQQDFVNSIQSVS